MKTPPVQPPPAHPKTERHWVGPLVVALTAFLWIASHLDPGGDYPHSPPGPGLVVDEIFYVSHGASQIDRLLQGDFTGYRKVVDELPDHPPLGKLWLGIWNEIGLLTDPPRAEHTHLVVAWARVGAASTFALLVFLSGWLASHWYGIKAGWWCSLALCAMPRLWGHAHLAVIEMPIALTYVATLFVVAATWNTEQPPNSRTAALAGIIFGLALLTKIQAVVLPFPVAIWALFRWKHRAVRPILIWGLTGTLMLFLGWTWFWGDPLERFPAYLLNRTGRGTIFVTYFGEKFKDSDVPWHYPWVIFLTTVPLLLQLVGFLGLGIVAKRGIKAEPRAALLALGAVFPLILFSLPKVGVYDGERLFLMTFPLWGLFIGIGGAQVAAWIEKQCGRSRGIVLCGLLIAAQFVGHLLMHPCYLSYYNILVGGISGADRLGLQVTYWGEGLTRDLVRRAAEVVPPGEVLEFGPVLHPTQIRGLLTQSPPLHQKRIQLVPLEEQLRPGRRYLLMFPRREYLPDSWSGPPPDARVIQEVRRQGVVMAGLYERQAQLEPGKSETEPR